MHIKLYILTCIVFLNTILAFFTGCSASSKNQSEKINYTEAQTVQTSEANGTNPGWLNQNITGNSTSESSLTGSKVNGNKTTESSTAESTAKASESKTANTGSTKSSKTISVPWDNDSKFMQAISKYGTTVLMAAYRTVLRDPLPGEEYNVHLAASMLSGRTVKPGQIFSQNDSIGPYTQSRGFKKGPTYSGTKLKTTTGGGVCKIASTLYNVTVLSNLQVVERHAHSMPVPYVPYGQDATVSYGERDFKFKNNTTDTLLIWAQGIDNILYIAFYGKADPPEVEWHHNMQKVKKAKIIYEANSSLKPGTERVTHEGMNGAFVSSWVTLRNADGKTTTKKMGTSSYSPLPYIIEKGE